MATYGGWAGKVLRVDLTTRTTSVENTLEKYPKFWGGTGLGYKVLWDETTADTKWSDPENPIVVASGPLCGTSCVTSGRWTFTSLSPYHQLSAVQSGHAGGHFGAELKFAGYDAIIIKGKASSLCYLSIRDDQVDIVDCPELAGVGSWRVTSEIQQAMGAGCQVAAVGQAGENMVPQACLVHNYKHIAQGAAVFGAKNLKGIGIVGTGQVKIAGNRKAWKAAVDLAMSLAGSNNQGVVPNNKQAWAEYSPGRSGTRWYAGPGKWWGAANPPIETGICLPHDRQKFGYRCFKSDPGVTAYPFTVRMDGCFGCPVRCNQVIDVPSAAKWGVMSTVAQETCTGWWGRSVMDTNAWASLTPANEKNVRNLEAYVVGMHMTNDYGISNDYGLLTRLFDWVLTTKTGGGAVADPYVKPAEALEQSYLQLNIPAAEWTNLTKAEGLLGLRKQGDLRAIMEFGRICAYKEGEFGKFIGDEYKTALERWKDANGNPLLPLAEADDGLQYWAWGFPKHHSMENGGQVGALLNIGFNRDPQNHAWINVWCNTGVPMDVNKAILETEFARVGWGAGLGEAADIPYPNGVTPMKEAKARAAKFCIMRKELHDCLGMCSWNWPFAVSPLRERGYRGDLSLEAKLFSIATGKAMTTMQLDKEMERFFVLQRLLTARAFKAVGSMREKHDMIPPWGLAVNHDKVAFDGTNYYLTQEDWDLALDMFYEEMGWEKTTGAPTAASLTALGMDDIIPKAQAEGLLA